MRLLSAAVLVAAVGDWAAMGEAGAVVFVCSLLVLLAWAASTRLGRGTNQPPADPPADRWRYRK